MRNEDHRSPYFYDINLGLPEYLSVGMCANFREDKYILYFYKLSDFSNKFAAKNMFLPMGRDVFDSFVDGRGPQTITTKASDSGNIFTEKRLRTSVLWITEFHCDSENN